jgi:hypothetical protein
MRWGRFRETLVAQLALVQDAQAAGTGSEPRCDLDACCMLLVWQPGQRPVEHSDLSSPLFVALS